MEPNYILLDISKLDEIEKAGLKDPEQYVVAYTHAFAPRIDLSDEAAAIDAANIIDSDYYDEDPEIKAGIERGVLSAYRFLRNQKPNK